MLGQAVTCCKDAYPFQPRETLSLTLLGRVSSLLFTKLTSHPIRSVGRKLLGLIALALDLDEGFFEQIGALNDPAAVVRLLRYPGIYVHQTDSALAMEYRGSDQWKDR
ncbi:hypothetical protein DY000_02054067 [Brassica cretica]|uniref:Uncharacterized protein n=1 Tax=Brassica cretica TaxID=69181 RepID=A0ABQ7AHS9_BRACR|nr:hypothetical protein DY000_02054067 [Brassica cretica]